MTIRRSLFCGMLLSLASTAVLAAPDAAALKGILQKNNCLACHAVDSPVVGPAYRDVAKKYKGDAAAPDKLFKKVREGGTGVWGQVAMSPNPGISDDDLHAVIAWILAGAPDH